MFCIAEIKQNASRYLKVAVGKPTTTTKIMVYNFMEDVPDIPKYTTD